MRWRARFVLAPDETHPAQSYSSSSKPYQAAVARVGLMHGICVVIAQLVDNLCYSVVIIGGECVPNDGLESIGGLGQQSVVLYAIVAGVCVDDKIKSAQQPLQRHGLELTRLLFLPVMWFEEEESNGDRRHRKCNLLQRAMLSLIIQLVSEGLLHACLHGEIADLGVGCESRCGGEWYKHGIQRSLLLRPTLIGSGYHVRQGRVSR